MEHAPLLPPHHDEKGDEDDVYQHHPQRWWLLFVLSTVAFNQAGHIVTLSSAVIISGSLLTPLMYIANSHYLYFILKTISHSACFRWLMLLFAIAGMYLLISVGLDTRLLWW